MARRSDEGRPATRGCWARQRILLAKASPWDTGEPLLRGIAAWRADYESWESQGSLAGGGLRRLVLVGWVLRLRWSHYRVTGVIGEVMVEERPMDELVLSLAWVLKLVLVGWECVKVVLDAFELGES
ncbi:hypothetical protein KM043_003498 [Ampulex compressa]|nr:hypothetical protein KM043_003498 [Ampulex compressa]